MSTAPQERTRPLLPPEERFWVRYSPHHEFPLAVTTAFFVYGLAIGMTALMALWYVFERDRDDNRPPTMDLVKVTGGGDGFEGIGGEPGLPGERKPMEAVPNETNNTVETPLETGVTLKDAPQVELKIPEVKFLDTKTDLETTLAKLAKDAEDQAKKEKPRVKKQAKIAMSGTGNPKGTGGQGGSGGGPGRGTKGTGVGIGGVGGRKPTKAEIYAWRWKFNLQGNAKQHIDQLKAIGFVVIVISPGGEAFSIKNISRVPVELMNCDPNKYKEFAQWKNEDVGSLLAFAGELKLRFVPARVLMCLPLDREEQIAAEELRFTKAHNNQTRDVLETYFEFRLTNGAYIPEAVLQVNNDGKFFRN